MHLLEKLQGRIIAVLLLPLLCVACVPSTARLTESQVRQLYALKVPDADPEDLQIPFALNDEIRQITDDLIKDTRAEEWRFQRIVRAIMDRIQSQEKVSTGETATAVEAYTTGKANCLSFSALFVGMTRHAGIRSFFAEIPRASTWDSTRDIVVNNQHVVGVARVAGDLRIVDFSPSVDLNYRMLRPIDDTTALAHYFQNRGAMYIIRGDVERAIKVLEIGLAIKPDSHGCLNNLGVAFSRAGRYPEAEEMLKRAIEQSPYLLLSYENLAFAYDKAGNSKLAEQVRAELRTRRYDNPYYYLHEGRRLFAEAKLDEALACLKRALRLDDKMADVHLALGQVYFRMGKKARASRHFARAVSLQEQAIMETENQGPPQHMSPAERFAGSFD